MLLFTTLLRTNTPECCSIIVILTELLFLPQKTESTSVSMCACQTPYCNHRFYTVPWNCQPLHTLPFPEFLRVFITLTGKLLRQLPFLMPAFSSHRQQEKNWREAVVESASYNKLFTYKHTRNWKYHACTESLQGLKLGLIKVHAALSQWLMLLHLLPL